MNNVVSGISFRDYQLTGEPIQTFYEHGDTEKQYNECLTAAALFYQNNRNFAPIQNRRNFYEKNGI